MKKLVYVSPFGFFEQEDYKSDSFTNVGCILVGSHAEVDSKVEKYFNQYHPAGYGTSIKSDRIIDGLRVVEITRYASCD